MRNQIARRSFFGLLAGIAAPRPAQAANEPVQVYGQIRATDEDVQLGNHPIYLSGLHSPGESPRVEVFVSPDDSCNEIRGFLKTYNGAFVELTFRHNPPNVPSNS